MKENKGKKEESVTSSEVPDVEITNIRVDNSEGNKKVTIHCDVKINKEGDEFLNADLLVSPKDNKMQDYIDGYCWQDFKKGCKESKDLRMYFSAKDLGIKKDGEYSYVITTRFYDGDPEDYDNTQNNQEKALQYYVELLLSVTTHIFSSPDIRVLNYKQK